MADTVQNPYRTLGIKPDASQEAIDNAYRQLAKRYHPSLNPGDDRALGCYREIKAAYRCLSDNEERARFDRAAAETGGLAPDGRREAAYIPARHPEPGWIEHDSEIDRTVIRLRPWATIGLALWMMFSLGYGGVRGLATELDGVVVGSYRVFAPLHYLMLWHRRSAREYVIRRADGSEQGFVVGPLCTLLSGTLPRRGAHIHKEAWQRTYELDGRTVSDGTPLCAIYFPVWLFASLSLLTIGIMDWATRRDARR